MEDHLGSLRLSDHLSLDVGSLDERRSTGKLTRARPDRQNLGKLDGACILYTSYAADDLLCVHAVGRRLHQNKKKQLLHIDTAITPIAPTQTTHEN